MWNKKKLEIHFHLAKTIFSVKWMCFLEILCGDVFSEGKDLDFYVVFVEKKRVLNLNEFYDKKLQCPNLYLVWRIEI